LKIAWGVIVAGARRGERQILARDLTHPLKSSPELRRTTYAPPASPRMT
jgi:hypothetical protein